MPARTPTKKAAPAKKPSPAPAKKPAKAARPAGPAKTPRNGDLEQARARTFEVQAAHDALASEGEKLRRQMSEKDDLLRVAQSRIANLEKQVEDGRKSDDGRSARLEQQVREQQARLTTRQAELEAARAETEKLREASRSRPGEAGQLRCPRCGGNMIEYTHGPVRADRCESCNGLFFDNGELEAVIKHHDDERDAGRQHWYSGIFGKR